MVRGVPIFVEKAGDRYPKEEREPGDDEVSHRIHVCELKK